MTVAELLSHPIFDLPARWPGSTYTDFSGQEHSCRSYHRFIINQFAAYQELLAQLDDIPVFGRVGLETRHPPVSNAEEVRRTVRLLCSGIMDTLNAYANGSPGKAYAELCTALEPPGRQILQSPAQLISTIYRNEEHVYYRLRQSDKPLTNPQSLFHLPFELRWRSRGYRFSIAGYPSLYAASSALLCLRELGRDSWGADLYASRLRPIPYASPQEPVRRVRLLDLRNPIAQFRERYGRPAPYDGTVIGFLTRWPLIMATSVRVGHPAEENPGFIEEYVLPQLLLEWVNNTRNRGEQDKISGIAYSSSRIAPGEPAFEGDYNIVVPAECPAATGLCSVRIRQFEVSPPVALSQVLSGSNTQSVEEIATRLEAELLTKSYERLPIEIDPGPQVSVV